MLARRPISDGIEPLSRLFPLVKPIPRFSLRNLPRFPISGGIGLDNRFPYRRMLATFSRLPISAGRPVRRLL